MVGRGGIQRSVYLLNWSLRGALLLEAYLHVVATKASARLPSSKTTLRASTILLYLKAASLWFHTILHLDVPVVCPVTQKILQLYRDVIAQALKWGMPLPKREPYTHEMLETFYRQARALVVSDPSQHLSCFLAVFGWIRLGLFTGSRGSEYCQTTARRHMVSRVPNDPAAGKHAGEPIAFILADFRFLTASDTIVGPREGLTQASSVIELHIRFRFDKSPVNGCWCKFLRTGHRYLCPVLAGLSIVQRALALNISPSDPLGVYTWTRLDHSDRSYTYLRSTELINIMRRLVIDTHPDPSHYLRQPDRIKCIDCHSNRVTACVALSEGNVSVDEIAHKLRWSVQSVKHYMRDCSRTVGATTAKVLQGFHNI